MSKFTRRDFMKLAGATSAMGALGFPLGALGKADQGLAKVVIIGGGYGGATCAKYMRKLAPGVHVTLVEQNKNYVTCPFSNKVIGGLIKIEDITHSYDNLAKRYGVSVVHDLATDVDPVKKTVKLKGGKALQYDRLVMSPGVDFVWNAIEGYDAAAAELMPHAWKAGPQTLLLRKQVEAMKDGGTVLICSPDNPYRCPPGPYERASLIANYLKEHKPKSKVVILDRKDKFSKQSLFVGGWEKMYPGMIEWVSKSAGGTIVKVDPKKGVVENDNGFTWEGDVVNVIPPHRAGEIAQRTGLVDDKGWCPVNQTTFESTKHADIYVIGDAAVAGQMPKSGYAAGSDITDKGIQSIKGNLGSPKDVDDTFRNMEAVYAQGWYDSTVADMFD